MHKSALVLGGTGALGSLVASRLWQESTAEVQILGRSGKTPFHGHQLAEGSVCIARCDASNSEEMESLIYSTWSSSRTLPGEKPSA